MKQKINLHIGYHKTGTTSLQKHLSKAEVKFNYIGRRYDGSPNDMLILEAAEAVACNRINDIENCAEKLKERIKSDAMDNSLISHENFLRPNQAAYNGLNLFVSLLKKDFEVEVFVSVRELPPLILSRFKHDLVTHTGNRIKIWRRMQNFIPMFITKWLLRYAIRPDGECYYPYCAQGKLVCHCGQVKKIPLNFYDIAYLKKEISHPFKTCDLLSRDNDRSRLELVFGESDVFPLLIHNATRFQTSIKNTTVMRQEIEREIARIMHQG